MSELYASYSCSNDNLVYNPNTLTTKAITLLSGQSVVRGEVLGKITLSVPTTGTAGSNTGAVTCTSVTGGASTVLGVYTIVCITTGTNTGTFSVKNPNGHSLPTATLGVAYTNNEINFTLNDVGTDPSLGDSFTITVAAGSGKYVKAVATNVNGSNKVEHLVIAANDIDATSGDATGLVYCSGEFNQGEITIDSSYTLANIKDELEQRGIYFKTAVAN